MTERYDVVRKVQGLQSVIDDSNTTDAERVFAREKITELRLRHGISDDEMTFSDEDEFRYRFYGLDIYRPHFKRIQDEIKEVLRKLNAIEDLSERAGDLAKFYYDLHQEVEGERPNKGKWPNSAKAARDQAIKDLYAAELAAYQSSEWRQANAADGENDEMTMLSRKKDDHEHARDRTASRADVRKDTVELIVGIHEKTFWSKITKLMEREDDSE